MKKHNLREASRLLIESILDKDPITANSIFQRLILEAEEAREEEANAEAIDELGFGDEELADDGKVNTGDIEAETDDLADDSIETLESDESEKIVNDIIEINCQINAKMIGNLFDRITELKNQLESKSFDNKSREYLEFEVSIEYYSDKLQDLQNRTNPGSDQAKVEAAVDAIANAIDKLEAKLANDQNSEDVFDVSSPEEVAAANELADDESDDVEEELSNETELDDSEESDDNESEESESDDNESEESEESDDNESEEELEKLLG